ncbi:signal transduction histidine kinase, partial [Novosphingobium sp. AP12]
RLAPAVSAGLVIRRRDTFAFVHDRVQQAAYDLVPAQGRQQAHLTLGRQLLAALPPEERHTAVFEVAAQFNRGASLLVAAEERARIAALHLEAGSRAAATSAHVTALAYLDAGLSILGEGSNSDLEFELRFRRAESHFLSGDLAAAQAGFATLAAGPLPGDRQARVAVQQITLATAQGDNEAAVAYFLAYMRAAGFDWPVHPDIEQVRAEFGPIFEEIRGNSIEDRLTLPDSDDSNPNILVLIAILPAAFLVDLNLEGLVLGRMVNESRYVNCPGSVVGYTTVGYVLGPLFGEYAAGYQFGCLGMELLERPHLSLFRPRAMMTFAYHILPYARPLHTARELHRKAYESAKEHDDVTYSGFSLCTLISNLLASGEPLASVERQAEKMLASMRRVKFGLIVDMLTSQLMLVRRLRGSTLSILTFDDGDFDEAAFAADFEARLASDRLLAMAACWHYVRKMEGAVFACDYRDALEASARAKSFLWTSVIHLERVEYHLFTAVALAALADENPGCEAALAEHHAELEVYARNAPKNWRHHADLVAAERARLAGYHIDALRGFEASAASARANGFHHIEALAHERAASFCADIGLFAMAEAHRERAHAAYLAWGADGKARAMAELYPSLDKGRGTSGTALSGVGDIDLATVIRSSEAVTGEIALGSLLPTLMRIALENACASRGLLLIPRRDGLWIEAESEVGADEVSVTLRQRAPNARDASLELLAEVVRTQAPVVVGDAISDPRMRDELSAAVRQVRSVLALPLVRQGKLIGVLYLENDATPHAFTPARLAVLRLLASQAAISLENAALEEKEQLLREVHHRVKNNLQLISSLLNLQASRTSDAAVAELFAESRNRVRSMALVHENLYRAGTFARVAMGDHVRALCSHLARAYGEAPNRNAVEVDVAEVELDLDRAIPCGLIVNELVSNALKHAFPDGRAGTIRVTLEAQRQGRFVLSVADDGVGLPDGAESGDTLGLQLVRDLTEQLRGRIEVRSEHGTSFSIIFGVPNGGVQ